MMVLSYGSYLLAVVSNLDTVVAFCAIHPKHTTRLDPRSGLQSSHATLASKTSGSHWSHGAARHWWWRGGRGGGEGGEPAEGGSEAGIAELRLVDVGRGKSSLLTRRHAGDAGGAAKSEARTHMNQQGAQQAGGV